MSASAPYSGLHEITDVADRRLLDWFDLWEASFPIQERVAVSNHLKALHERMSGEDASHRFYVAQDEAGAVVGIARVHLIDHTKSTHLWYYATSPERRGEGIGSSMYRDLVAESQRLGMAGMYYQVEEPDCLEDEDARTLARRRITFYERVGAKLLTGAVFEMELSPDLPVVSFLTMYHRFDGEDLPPEKAFEIMAEVLAPELRKTGDLAWG